MCPMYVRKPGEVREPPKPIVCKEYKLGEDDSEGRRAYRKVKKSLLQAFDEFVPSPHASEWHIFGKRTEMDSRYIISPKGKNLDLFNGEIIYVVPNENTGIKPMMMICSREKNGENWKFFWLGDEKTKPPFTGLIDKYAKSIDEHNAFVDIYKLFNRRPETIL